MQSWTLNNSNKNSDIMEYFAQIFLRHSVNAISVSSVEISVRLSQEQLSTWVIKQSNLVELEIFSKIPTIEELNWCIYTQKK